MQTELSRRIQGNWRKVPTPARHLWVIEALEPELYRWGARTTYQTEKLPEMSSVRPRIDDLVVAYQDLELTALAQATESILVALTSDPDGVSPLTVEDKRYQLAVAQSATARLAWIDAHLNSLLPDSSPLP
jgi:hypothetical protein